jgi:glycosyltransferase involved in cell wall biosynthesis
MNISAIIPAYNAAKEVKECLVALAASSERVAEIVVVDDGSSDATAALAETALRSRRGRLLRNGDNRGKGYSVRQGVLASAGRFVLVTDADLSTPIEEYVKLAAAARDRQLDLAFGSRALPDSDVQVRQGRLRQSMGRAFNRIIRLLTGLPYGDTQCGFKLMDRERGRGWTT